MLYKVANVITGAGSEASKPDEGASLTSVLETPALRVELALLLLLCTDAMRSDLAATFDPNKTHETTSSTASSLPTSPKPQAPPVQDLISFDVPEDEAASAAERARRARQAEVESTPLQALRRSALTFFDKWRAGVMHRICDVLCVRGEVVRQAKAKRKQSLEETERARTGNSLLIDFGGDPFETSPSVQQKHGRYAIVVNKLLSFDEEKRVLVLHCVLLLLLSLEHYPAHSRVLLLHLASSLKIDVDLLTEHEKAVAQGLLATAASQMDAEESAKKQAVSDSSSRRWKVGLAAVGGAVLIGVTGGLAAPLLAAGVGTVMGGLGLGAISGYLGALAGSSVLVGSLFGAYGGKMTGRLVKQYAREVEDFEFIPVQDPGRPSAQRSSEWAEELDARDPEKREQHRLRISIGISGWLSSPADVNKPWEVVDTAGTEPFALRFELDSMLRLGNSLNDVLFSYAWDGVTYTVVSRTLLGALYAGLWPLGLVKVASVLDNPFSIALARADKAGKVLARALIDKVQGERPVTLMGYSIGARVIYSCLVQLAEQHAFGLIESVILMGAPVPSDSRSWRQIRSVVSARVVNVYSTEDFILGFLYRSTKLQMGVAGLHEVKDVFGIENVDMSKLITGHDRYRYLVGTILTKTGFGDVDFNKVAEQERALEMMEKKKEQVRAHVKRHKKDTNQPEPDHPGPVGMVVVKETKNEGLIDVSAPSADYDASYPRRTMMQNIQQQSRGHGQQPQRSASSRDSGFDLPTGSILPTVIDEPLLSPPTRTPIVSANTHRQIPTNMVPTPDYPPRNISQPSVPSYHSKVIMRDLDTQKFSPPLEEMLRSAPVTHAPPSPVAVTQPESPKRVPTATINHAEEENTASEEDRSDDEGSLEGEFGELSMVEPVPLEEGDFGLM